MHCWQGLVEPPAPLAWDEGQPGLFFSFVLTPFQGFLLTRQRTSLFSRDCLHCLGGGTGVVVLSLKKGGPGLGREPQEPSVWGWRANTGPNSDSCPVPAEGPLLDTPELPLDT